MVMVDADDDDDDRDDDGDNDRDGDGRWVLLIVFLCAIDPNEHHVLIASMNQLSCTSSIGLCEITFLYETMSVFE